MKRPMPSAWVLFAVFAAAVSLHGQSLKPSQQAVEIDGRKNPELLPEWVVWQEAFRDLALIKAKDAKAFKASLVLSPEEAELVYKEADAQVARDRRCMKELDARYRTLTSGGVEPDVAVQRVKELEVACRWGILEARSRLLAALTPEGQATLVAWVNEARAGIRVIVDDLEHFRRPR